MRVCAVCSTPCPAPFRVPTAEMAPDLDGRPGEPARSTLKRWLTRCRGCAAVAPDLAALPPGAAEIVRAPGFSAERNSFLRWAALCTGSGDADGAAEAVLQAAWNEEDAGRDGSALRRRAADAWRGDPLRRVDILRCAGALAEADAVAVSLTGLEEDARQIIAFERGRIAAGDTARHSIASALRPPARTPHVTHGKSASSGGLFGRLFRR